MTELTKTVAVLSRATMRAAITDHVGFMAFPDSDDERVRMHHVAVDAEVWRDMGEPDVVTVTIEPGDRLNEASGQS